MSAPRLRLGKRAMLIQLIDIYMRAAMRVAINEDDYVPMMAHETACSALVIEAGELTDTAFAPYMYWFGQPKDYWFGRNAVYSPLKESMPDKYLERIVDVRANQQARIYSLLFMWAMARTGDIDGL